MDDQKDEELNKSGLVIDDTPKLDLENINIELQEKTVKNSLLDTPKLSSSSKVIPFYRFTSKLSSSFSSFNGLNSTNDESDNSSESLEKQCPFRRSIFETSKRKKSLSMPLKDSSSTQNLLDIELSSFVSNVDTLSSAGIDSFPSFDSINTIVESEKFLELKKHDTDTTSCFIKMEDCKPLFDVNKKKLNKFGHYEKFSTDLAGSVQFSFVSLENTMQFSGKTLLIFSLILLFLCIVILYMR